MTAVGAEWTTASDCAATHERNLPFHAEVSTTWSHAAPAWEATLRTGPATAFQQPTWLKATCDVMVRGGASPLLVTLKDSGTGQIAMHVPLMLRRAGGLRVIEFLDLVSDFNAPILGPAAPSTPGAMTAAWRALRAVLPRADLMRLARMPLEICGRPNPLARLPGAHACAANGNLLTLGDDYEAYRYGLPRTVRKELERSWRVFTRHPQAAFRVITDPAEALRIMTTMETQQGERMRGLGVEYLLDDPRTVDFYRRIATDGVADGSAVLTALTAGEELVGALLGIRNRDTYVMVRISHAGGEWSTCSPGRLVIERTMRHLHGQGLRRFDFSIGNYAYKRRFAPERTPLVDLLVPLTWRGLVPTARAHVAERLRRKPALRALVRRLLGKPALREEA